MTYYQPIKTMYIYRALINRESKNMGLVPDNFYPRYSVEEINTRQLSIAETTMQPFPFAVRLQVFFRTSTIHHITLTKILFFLFFQKYKCEQFCWSNILLSSAIS